MPFHELWFCALLPLTVNSYCIVATVQGILLYSFGLYSKALILAIFGIVGLKWQWNKIPQSFTLATTLQKGDDFCVVKAVPIVVVFIAMYYRQTIKDNKKVVHQTPVQVAFLFMSGAILVFFTSPQSLLQAGRVWEVWYCL